MCTRIHKEPLGFVEVQLFIFCFQILGNLVRGEKLRNNCLRIHCKCSRENERNNNRSWYCSQKCAQWAPGLSARRQWSIVSVLTDTLQSATHLAQRTFVGKWNAISYEVCPALFLFFRKRYFLLSICVPCFAFTDSFCQTLAQKQKIVPSIVKFWGTLFFFIRDWEGFQQFVAPAFHI